MQTTIDEARDFFSQFFMGAHNIPSPIKEFGQGWRVNLYGTLSSFDFDGLTRLVFLCHDMGFRAEVAQGGPNRLIIAVWKRTREGRLFERHPDISEALNTWRKDHPGDDISSGILKQLHGYMMGDCTHRHSEGLNTIKRKNCWMCMDHMMQSLKNGVFPNAAI